MPQCYGRKCPPKGEEQKREVYVPQKGAQVTRYWPLRTCKDLSTSARLNPTVSNKLWRSSSSYCRLRQEERGVMTVESTSYAHRSLSPSDPYHRTRLAVWFERLFLKANVQPRLCDGDGNWQVASRSGVAKTRETLFHRASRQAPFGAPCVFPAHNVRRSWPLQANSAWSGRLPASAEAVSRILCVSGDGTSQS